MKAAKRPRLLLILLLLFFGQAAMYLTYFVLYGLYTEQSFLFIDNLARHGLIHPARLVGTWMVLGVASVIIGVGLRRGRPWAWTAAMTLEGAIFTLALGAYFNRQANIMFYVAMAAAIAITFLLNQREIQIFYRANRVIFEGQFGR
ncbi:MAG: hypothetical protein AABZ58_15710 [Chloroflexota bacterium]